MLVYYQYINSSIRYSLQRTHLFTISPQANDHKNKHILGALNYDVLSMAYMLLWYNHDWLHSQL